MASASTSTKPPSIDIELGKTSSNSSEVTDSPAASILDPAEDLQIELMQFLQSALVPLLKTQLAPVLDKMENNQESLANLTTLITAAIDGNPDALRREDFSALSKAMIDRAKAFIETEITPQTASDIKVYLDVVKTLADIEKTYVDIEKSKKDVEKADLEMKKLNKDMEKTDLDMEKSKQDMKKTDQDMKRTDLEMDKIKDEKRRGWVQIVISIINMLFVFFGGVGFYRFVTNNSN
jgi:hypothetical protein